MTGPHAGAPTGGTGAPAPYREPDHVLVVIPALNEEATIAAAMRSVYAAFDRVAHLDTSLVVVVEAGSDTTLQCAAGLVRDRRDTLLLAVGRGVGAARRRGVEYGLATTPTPPSGVWLASTDADTLMPEERVPEERVPEDWIERQLEVARRRRVVGVAGTVALDDDASPLLHRRFAQAYGVRGSADHPTVHGANLGMRADAYLEAGGWRNLPGLEDRDLWTRLSRRFPTASPPDLTVRTSGRTVGRAPFGFANELAMLAQAAG